MAINTVIFDFDGTLVNTNKVILASWQHTYVKYLGHEMPEEHITSCFGEPLRTTMAREFPDVDTDEAIEVYSSFQNENAKAMVELFEGIPQLLKELRRRHFKLAVVTSRTREGTDFYLNMLGMKNMFNAVVTKDDTKEHKPEPEPILFALEKLGIYRDEAIMVGDSAFDIKCANNAEVESVLVGWSITSGESEQIGDYDADYMIDEPDELLDLLEDLNSFKDPSDFDRD